MTIASGGLPHCLRPSKTQSMPTAGCERQILPLHQNPRAALALGRSERTATRKARRLETASFGEFRRLTPEQNVKLGLSPKARHYVLKAAKRVTKATPTISARQFETKRARELYKLTPEAGDRSAPPGRDSLHVCRSARAGRARRRSRERKTGSSRRSRSSAHRARRCRAIRRTSARHGSSYPVSAGCRAPLPRHKAAQARWGAHPGWRMAMVHRLRTTTKGPPV